MLAQRTLTDFLAELASDSPAPGGGSVAALAGALAAALTGMVCRLTVGNPKYADVDAKLRSVLEQADVLRAELTKLIDEDAAVFNQVMAAYKLPKATDAEKAYRSEAIQQALKAAALLPLTVAERCCELLELAQQALTYGNANAASDAAVAGAMANAALKAAVYNVKINVGSIKDEGFTASMQQNTELLNSRAAHLYREIEAGAAAKLG